jgi:ectoine hydroxylase-related dioxygenase (phytanoyl-CoA dioxygenase family)
MSRLSGWGAGNVRRRFAAARGEQHRMPDTAMRTMWDQSGYVVLPQVASEEVLCAVDTEVAQLRATNGETKDEQGFGDRVGMAHQRLASCLRLAANPGVFRFLSWAFGEPPLLFGSLHFERGTHQAAHIDAMFFYTEPVTAMAGVWFCLEDVHPDAGPLFYVDGSHRWPFVRGEEIWQGWPERADEIERARHGGLDEGERARLASDLGVRWTDMLMKDVADRGAQKTPAIIKRGDCLVWHALLVHGGLPRLNPALSRRSIVFHYIGCTAREYDFATFFLSTNDEIRADAGLQWLTECRDDLLPGFAYMRHDYTTKMVDGVMVFDRHAGGSL